MFLIIFFKKGGLLLYFEPLSNSKYTGLLSQNKTQEKIYLTPKKTGLNIQELAFISR